MRSLISILTVAIAVAFAAPAFAGPGSTITNKEVTGLLGNGRPSSAVVEVARHRGIKHLTFGKATRVRTRDTMASCVTCTLPSL